MAGTREKRLTFRGMRLKTLKPQVDLRGKRVLVRIDANVPIVKGAVVDGSHGRIARASVGLEWLRQRGARVIIVSHFGRPDGRRASAYSLQPVAERLSELLGVPVPLIRSITGKDAEARVQAMKDGQVVLLENIRFDAREERNSPALARELARLGDLYVNDAFSVCHRAHASVEGIAEELPAYAGPDLANEVSVLSKLLRHPRRPVVLVMGGFKMADKIPVLERWLPQVDRVLIGGALATCFLKADGMEIGASSYDEKGVAAAKRLLKAHARKILLPLDVVVARNLERGTGIRTCAVTEIGEKEKIADVGPRSMRLFARELHVAKTIVWNGPFGVMEHPAFAEASKLLARAIAVRTGKATTIVGGGDTLPFVESLGLADRYTLLSTGGGAMLEFLSGKELPGLTVLHL